MSPSDNDSSDSSQDGDGGPCRVVVAGYGPVGRFVVERLSRAGVALTIVELNIDTIQKQLALDKSVVFGDISTEEIMVKAGIEKADVLVLAVPDEQCAVRACALARRLNPSIFIAARTSYVSQGLLASRAGADEVVIEELVTAEAMGRVVMNRLRGEGE